MEKPTRLALGIGFAGAVCAAMALASPPLLAWVPAWIALSCAVLAYAYARNRPDVFGKRDGRLSILRTLALLPYLVAFRISCAIMRARRKADPWNEVAPGVYVGARLRGDQLPPGVELVVDLTCEFDEPAELRSHPGYRCLPVLDGSVPPDEEAFLSLLEEVGTAQGGVLFHCESGKGRAPTAAALALLARGVAEDTAVALELVGKGRPASKPTSVDLRFVERMALRLGRG